MTETPFGWVAKLQADAIKSGKLGVWTIFDHPTDHPEDYVARQFLTDKNGVTATPNILSADDPDLLREVLQAAGLWKLARDQHDDPKIMESWI